MEKFRRPGRWERMLAIFRDGVERVKKERRKDVQAMCKRASFGGDDMAAEAVQVGW